MNPSVLLGQADVLFSCLSGYCAASARASSQNRTLALHLRIVLKCHLKRQKFMVSALTSEGRCALVTLLHMTLHQLKSNSRAKERLGRLLTRFQPPFQARLAGASVAWPRNNSCSLCNRWPGGKF